MVKKMEHSEAFNFIFAGKCTVTFRNNLSGNRFTFKVEKCKDNDKLFFIKVLTNPDQYAYIGTFMNGNYKHSVKSKIGNDATSVKVFQYVIHKLITKTLEDFIEIWHEGKCGRCGKKLTVPESIETGFGVVCLSLI